MRAKMVLLTIILPGLLIACASVDPQPRWGELETITRDRTQGSMVWEQTSEDAEKIQTKVSELLADGLTRDEAVRIALLNNRSLQAAFEEIGAAEADLVQAGLLSNPSFDAVLAFPISAGNSGGALLGFLSDIWTIPARKAVFTKQTEIAVQRVGFSSVSTATEAAKAYDELLYRNTALDLEKNILNTLDDLVARMNVRYDRGLENDLDMESAKLMKFDQQILVHEAQEMAMMAQTRLSVALSLPFNQPRFALTDSLEALPESDWTVDSATKFAHDHRLDLAIAKLNVEKSEKNVAFQRTQIFQKVGLGPVYEGDFDDENTYGPGLSMELPIFDQNQAQIAKAEYRLRQARKELESLELTAAKEIADTLALLDFLRAKIMVMQDHIMPSLDRKVAYAEKWGHAHQLNLLNLIMAQEDRFRHRRMYMESLRDYRHAQVTLHQALWGGSMN